LLSAVANRLSVDTATEVLLLMNTLDRKSALNATYRVNLKKCPNTKITISQKCANNFIPNFAHLFTRQLYTSLLLCDVFTWRTPNWRKHKLQNEFCNL